MDDVQILLEQLRDAIRNLEANPASLIAWEMKLDPYVDETRLLTLTFSLVRPRKARPL
jgi:hypothetical protein